MTEESFTTIVDGDRFYEIFRSELEQHDVLLAKVQVKNIAWINSEFGVKVGDEVLSAIKQELLHMRRSFLVGEMSPTLYGVMCKNPADPEGLVEAIETTVTDLNRKENWPFLVELAFGVVVADKNISTNIFQWISQANTALMVSSRKGHGKVYLPDFGLEQKIRLTLGKLDKYSRQFEGFEFVFQPVHNIESGARIGYETLARWTSEELGPISPEFFIGIAEDLGVVHVLDRWAASAAAEACEAFRAKGVETSISANASAITLQTDREFVPFVRGLVEKHNLTRRQFVIELTESSVIQNMDLMRDILNDLQEIGVQIAIDDFGKGETNLAGIATLPYDFLKLDKSLLRIQDKNEEKSMLRIGADIGRVIGVGVLCEGVETEEDYQIVKQSGVRLGQGYYFGKPEPLEYYLNHA